MKIAIHHTQGSFSERWISYCKKCNILYKLVNCYHSDIVEQLADCDALLWHFHHKDSRDSKFAKQLLFAVELSGKKVFPNFNTVWHFDDKVAQKYLLEALEAPVVPGYVFYSKTDALKWANETKFPKVFKLRNGSGSDNVRLIKDKKAAAKLIRIAFDHGFNQYDAWNNLKERWRKYLIGKNNIWNIMKGIIRLAHTTRYARLTPREAGYVYFQDFIPGNKFDIRVIVIGDKAFAIKRMVRKNDFRASGSGYIFYEKENFEDNIIRVSFEVSEKLRSQCMAYDFIYNQGNPFIVEISYGFSKEGYDPCPGYWDRKLIWHEGKFNPYGWMIETLWNDSNRE